MDSDKKSNNLFAIYGGNDDYIENHSIYTNMSECLMYGINRLAWLVHNCPKL